MVSDEEISTASPAEADEERPRDKGQEQFDEASASEGGKADATEAAATVEAILFSSDTPLPPKRIAELAELGGVRDVRSAVDALNARYDEPGSSFRIESIAGGYQMMTLPEYHDVVSRLHKSRSEAKLSQAALETLAIVAYRQPILRADIEAIRGVACGEVLRGLMEKQLIKIAGRAEVLGRPMLYGTTRRFLDAFGLASLKGLPRIEELRGGAPDADKGGPHGEDTSSNDDQKSESASQEPTDDETSGEVPADQATSDQTGAA